MFYADLSTCITRKNHKGIPVYRRKDGGRITLHEEPAPGRVAVMTYTDAHTYINGPCTADRVILWEDFDPRAL